MSHLLPMDSGGSGICSLGAVGSLGWPYFQLWVTELYYRSEGSRILGEGVRQGVCGPEGKAFSN